MTDVAFNAAETFQTDEDEILHAGAFMYEEKNGEAMRTQQAQAKEAPPQETNAEPKFVSGVVEGVGAQRGPRADELVGDTTAEPTGEVNAQSGQALPRWSQHGANDRESLRATRPYLTTAGHSTTRTQEAQAERP